MTPRHVGTTEVSAKYAVSFCVGAELELVGLTSSPTLNGTTVTVVEGRSGLGAGDRWAVWDWYLVSEW